MEAPRVGSATADAMAAGLNASANRNPNFLSNLITNLNADAGRAIGEGVNAMAVGGQASALYATLSGAGENTARALAGALNDNKPFLDALLARLDGASLAAGINGGIYNPSDPSSSLFLLRNLQYTDADTLATIMNSTGGTILTNNLVANLDGSLVAQALNMNESLQPLLYTLLGTLDGAEMAKTMNRAEGSLQLNLDVLNTPGIAESLVKFINRSILNPSKPTLLDKMGIGQMLKSTVYGIPFLDKIYLDILGYGIVQQVGVGTLPPPNALPPPDL